MILKAIGRFLWILLAFHVVALVLTLYASYYAGQPLVIALVVEVVTIVLTTFKIALDLRGADKQSLIRRADDVSLVVVPVETIESQDQGSKV